MKASAAIRQFMNTPGYDKVTVAEIKALKKACSPEEYEELGRQACKLMDMPFETADNKS